MEEAVSRGFIRKNARSVAATAELSLSFNLGQTSWEYGTANTVPWVWNGQCGTMASVTTVQFEL